MATNHTARPRKNESPERFIKRFIKKCKKTPSLMKFETASNTQSPRLKNVWQRKKQLQDKKKLRKQN